MTPSPPNGPYRAAGHHPARADSVDVAPTFGTALPVVDLPTVAGTEVLTRDDLQELAITPAEPRLATAREALFNCVNILLGCGVLSIPYALEQGGWAAFGVLALMWISTNYTGKVLIQCQEYFNRHPDALPQPGSTISMTEGLMASCASPPPFPARTADLLAALA